MSKEILVFKKERTNDESIANFDEKFQLKIWNPGLFRFIPPNKDYKYFLYWFFHFAGIFQNKCYSAYLLYSKTELVSSFLVVPAYFKWPFMKSKDVQFTYVMTDEKYQGMGIAGKLIINAIEDLNPRVDAFWYVTDTKNIASIKVAEKLGFKCIGEGERTNLLKKLRLKSDYENNLHLYQKN